MIIVVADDFTGASEIAGVALRHGLKSILTTTVDRVPSADIWVIATDIRSLPLPQAMDSVRGLAERLTDIQADFFFFKIDSVLRGYPVETLLRYRELMRRHWVLLVAANPSNGRIIRNGIYYVDGVPIGESSFAPYGVDGSGSSYILDFLPAWARPRLQVCTAGERIAHDKPIVIGNVETEDGLKKWAARLDRDMLAAGGADFFDAILSLRDLKPAALTPIKLSGPSMMVCGSFHVNSKRAIDLARQAGVPIAYMPDGLLRRESASDTELIAWVDDIVAQLNDSGRVVVAVRGDVVENGMEHIRNLTGDAVKIALARVRVDDLLVEGGATAAAILDRLDYGTYHPIAEWNTGIVTMAVEGSPLRLTTKPGSYLWPEGLWNRLISS